MLTAALAELGRRAVACKAWRWLPGMVDHHGRRIHKWSPSEPLPAVLIADPDAGLNDQLRFSFAAGLIPNFSDPATLGCLLALVREAWADEGVVTTRPAANGGFLAVAFTGLEVGHGATEADALVAALEAAPAREVVPC